MKKRSQEQRSPTAESRARARGALRDRGGRLVQVGLEPEDAALLASVREATGATTDAAAIVAALRLAGAGHLVQALLTQKEAAALSSLMKSEGLDERDAIGAAIMAEAARAKRRANG